MKKFIGNATRGGRVVRGIGGVVLLLLGALGGNPSWAATYLPIPDSALAGSAPVIVRARAGESAARLAETDAGPRIVTATEFDVLDLLKGRVEKSSIRLVLPGGRVGETSLWIPGTPVFVPGQEVVLFLSPIPGRPGEYGPTEFALSVFDVLEDPLGHRFAVRALFQAGEAEVLDPNGDGAAEPDHLREAGPFLEALRAAGRGEPMPSVPRRSPSGPLQMVVETSSGVRPLWVNIGGVEGEGDIFKWFWGTGSGCSSPVGVVRPVGTQTNLTDGTNGLTHLQNAANEWAGVSGTDVRYSYSASSGNVDVSLDVASYSGGWAAPMDCGMGVLGIGGPSSRCRGTFKSTQYWACDEGTVSMRRSTCSTGYAAAVFRSAVLHEVGHTLGLGHPDQGVSLYSTTSSSARNAAVMRSSIPAARPDTPQEDDIAAIEYYYGLAVSLPPVANFGFSPSSPTAGQTVSFSDTSSNTPTSWAWNFGDPASGGSNTSASRNPTHVFTSAGTYTVTLTATNAQGSDDVTKQVTVSAPPPPVANFSYSPSSPAPGQNVQFTDASTGAPTGWSWSFGDGGTSTARHSVHAYASAGSYSVRLTATNASGSSDRVRTVTVSQVSPPVAAFSFSPSPAVAGQPISFFDESGGVPTSRSWNFGDGTSSTSTNPVKTYLSAGTYLVSLQVSNTFGTDSESKQVLVSAAGTAPVASFTFAPSSPQPGQVVQFTDTSTGGPTAWSWDFGDGTFSPARNPTKTYAAAANYTVRLLVSNALGSKSTTRTVPVSSSGPFESVRVIPVVLDAFGVGTSRFRSELVLANRGRSRAAVELTYTASSALNATGSGTVTESLAPGQQWILDDVLAHLRGRGLAIPQAATGASQGGSLRVRFRNLSEAAAGAAVARTTALLPQGRAGVAYPALAPGDWNTAAGQQVFGLRESIQERSNLGLVNLDSTADVGLRITLNSGALNDRRKFVLPETYWLKPLQWTQLGSVLARAGFTNGWALVERVSGNGPFYSYGVFNDSGTNDGSFIDPIPVGAAEPARTIPVVLELGIYSTELIVANPTAASVRVTLQYVESLAAAGEARLPVSLTLLPSEQKIVDALPFLRSLGANVGPESQPHAGSLAATFQSNGIPANGFAGARTKSPGQPQGAFGVYYSGLTAGQAVSSEAWVFGLKQDGESRSNVAIVNAGTSGGPITLQAEVFDGGTGASRGGTGNVVLAPGQWFQWNELLESFGLTQGYARVFRVEGTSPFLAYGVVNDGGTSRPGTNDGSYVPMLGGR